MNDILEKIQKIDSIKEEIKDAIVEKGVEIGDRFADYPNAIKSIESGGLKFDEDQMELKAASNISIVTPDMGIAKIAATVTNMNKAFINCRQLTYVNLPELPNVTNMGMVDMTISSNDGGCFRRCRSLGKVTLQGLPKVTTMYSCFAGCSSLTNISLPELPNVTNMSDCFAGCSSLTNISLPELPNVQNIYNCFGYCTSLTSISLPELPNVTNLSYCFNYCKSLKSVTFPSLPNVTNISYCFYHCTSLTSISLPELPNVSYMHYWLSGGSGISYPSLKKIVLQGLPKVTDICNGFTGCISLRSIVLPDLPNITCMSYCFDGCTLLQDLTIGNIGSSIGYSFTAISGLNYALSVSSCTLLTHDSLMNLINALPTKSSNLCLWLGITNLNKLTDEEKAIVTNKGWTLQ